MKPLPQKQGLTILWSTTKAASVLEQEWRAWSNNDSVIAKSGDRCKIGSWVVVQKTSDMDFHIGRIAELLSPLPSPTNFTTKPSNVITIERFILGPIRHPHFNMPVLHRQQGDPEAEYLVLFRLSVQHDCRSMLCSATGTRAVIQERKTTERTTQYIEHTDDKRFVINMHALHNANSIRTLLPRNLTKPIPLHSDREKWHHDIATSLRTTQTEKRKKTQEKHKKTLEENQQRKQAHRAQIEGSILDNDQESENSDEEEEIIAKPATKRKW
ncbi:hypothetical protein F5876DRAFT_54308 [Lentinula aff. lateritia]|uniref:Uncharacterized protein n=1 Tax=Lentinula aff. lateritia TaxID=2804960 RepID=A0ACC1TFT1_9AGAR|nr:hypothetical protein F5876DRAFT_54308 [Lentinula aff. lateritia]